MLLICCLAKIPSERKMSLNPKLDVRIEPSFRPRTSRSVTDELNENRTKHRVQG
jgi:hypothetical protein